jgi:hypothetical protein
MSCEKIHELIQHHLDLSLTGSQRAELNAHLDSCLTCREQLESYRKMVELFEQEEEIEVPENFTSRVMANLPEVDFAASGRSRGFGAFFDNIVRFPLQNVFVPATMAAAVLLGVGVYFGFSSFSGNAPQEAVEFDVARRIVPAKTPADEPGVSEPEVGRRVSPARTQNLQMLTLSVESGVVRVKRDDSVYNVRRGEEFTLAFRDEVETGVRTRAHVTYPQDNIRLGLEASTRLQLASNSIRFYQGDTWVHVVKKGTKFEVQTPNLVAAVRGTIFTAEVDHSYAPLYDAYSYHMGAFVTEPVYSESVGSSFAFMRKGLEFASAGSLPEMLRTRISVFEGEVMVQSLADISEKVALTEYESAAVVSARLSPKTIISEDTAEKWSPYLAAEGLETKARRVSEGKEVPGETETTEAKPEVDPPKAFDQLQK